MGEGGAVYTNNPKLHKLIRSFRDWDATAFVRPAKIISTVIVSTANLLKQPCFDEMRTSGNGYRVVGNLSNTDRIMRDTFWIGVYPGMTDEKIDYMIEKIREVAK